MSDSEESDTELANEIIKEQPVTKQKRQMSAEHLEKLRQGRIKSLEIRSKKGNEKKAVKLDKSLQETEKKLNELKIKKQPPKEEEEEDENPAPVKVVKKKKKQPTVIFESDEDDDDNDRVIYVRRREKKVMPRPLPPQPPPLQPLPFIQPSPPPEPIKPKFTFKRPAYYNQYANY
tara:strand:- start:91 stop:615 length:525 start_codon:yes stop_codon:yes gene_type:complete